MPTNYPPMKGGEGGGRGRGERERGRGRGRGGEGGGRGGRRILQNLIRESGKFDRDTAKIL